MSNTETVVETEIIFLSPDQWAKIKDNPIQRDTIKHATSAARAGNHLSTPHPTHGHVAMARLPNGTEYKLDGHSRSYLHSEGILELPEELTVTVYNLPNRQSVLDFYRTFDASQAVESRRDLLFGAFRLNKFSPAHGYLFQNVGVLAAMSYCLFATPAQRKRVPIDVLVKPWLRSLEIFDSGDFPNHLVFSTPNVLAALLTIRRDGNKALSFWQSYADGEGSKAAKSCDGIYAAEDAFRTMKVELKGGGGQKGISTYTPYFLYAYDQWKNKSRLKPFGNIGNKKQLPADMFAVGEWYETCLGEPDHYDLMNPQQELDL